MKWKLERGIVLKVEEIRNLVIKDELELPKYAASIINLANKFAQATRPNIVGQMSELVKECPYRDFEGWRRWYMEKYPYAIENATNKLMNMLENFKDVMNELDTKMVRKWVEDLVLVKTFIGLRVQEPILKYFANALNQNYRLATPEEESKGIDGYLDDYKISIKPTTYEEKRGIAGESPAGDIIIFYEKDKDNNVIITEIESLSDGGEKLIAKLKGLVTRNSSN